MFSMGRSDAGGRRLKPDASPARRKANRRAKDPAVRSKNLSVHFSSKTCVWATPQDFFDKLDAEFGFALDVCALRENAKCKRYFTPEVNGLVQEWRDVCWMNPPYGREIGRWVAKAFESARNGATVVCLLPARTDTAWWHDYVMQACEIRFVRGRLRFGGAESGAPFPSAVVVFRPWKSPTFIKAG
jgi:site-specific DNA-methyltransferase (adenine-specific)